MLVDNSYEYASSFIKQLTCEVPAWTTKLKKMEVHLRDKEQNKEVSDIVQCAPM